MSNTSSTTDGNDVFNYAYFLRLRLIVVGYLGMVLSLFGIVGNIITTLVLLSPSMRTKSTNLYLAALSCSNILFLSMFIPAISVMSILDYRSYMTHQLPSAFHILLRRLPSTPTLNASLLSVVYLTIAVSMDRFISIKFPLKAKQLITQRRTLIVILSVYIFSIVYCIPIWLEEQYNPNTKRCHFTSIGRKTFNYTRVYIRIPILYLIPLIILTYINIAIIKNLIVKKLRKKSLGLQTNIRRQADSYVILMLVTVILVFVLSHSPITILRVMYTINHKDLLNNPLFPPLQIFGELMFILNTSTNFLINCFFGKKFRQTLVELILHIIPNNNNQSNLQIRISRLSATQNSSKKNIQPSPLPEHKQSIQSGNSLIITTDLNSTSNQNLIKNASINTQELFPLMTISEEISVIPENFPYKPDQHLNLYTDV